MPTKSSTPIVYRKLSDLVKLAHNPRTIKKEDMERLMASISKFGVLEGRPFLLSNRTGELVIIGGNMRYEACKKLKIEEVPTHLIEGLTEDEEKEIIIRDNVSNGEWDMEMLANEWGDEPLAEWGVDVSFETVEEQAEEDDFEVDEGIKTDIVLGDLFEIGPHRLLYGDSTNIDDVNKLMNGEKADMVFTDPPYLMDFGGTPDTHGKIGKVASGHEKIKNDKMSEEDGERFLDDVNTTIQAFCKGAFYISFYRLGIDKYFSSMKRTGMKWRNLIIWNKGTFSLSNSDYKSQYEPIIYGWIDDHNFYGGNNKKDIWDIDRTKVNDLHPTMKPIALMEIALNDSSKAGDVVLDLFGGSGSTMVACHQLNRKCYMSELDPKYVQTIVNRMIKLDPSIEVKRNGKPYVNTSE